MNRNELKYLTEPNKKTIYNKIKPNLKLEKNNITVPPLFL